MAKNIEIKSLDRQTIVVDIIGTSPLIVHKFSEKSRKQMLAKQMKETFVREAKNPEQDFRDALYILDADPKDKKSKERYGFPVDGLKQAMVRGAKALGMVMTDARGAFFVEGEYAAGEGRDMIEIQGTPEMREDVVRLETGVADIRFRPQFTHWKSRITISFNGATIGKEQLLNMLNTAGFSVGIGEWRPERNGTMGRFQVAAKA